jgi:hypothetical protein
VGHYIGYCQIIEFQNIVNDFHFRILDCAALTRRVHHQQYVVLGDFFIVTYYFTQ